MKVTIHGPFTCNDAEEVAEIIAKEISGTSEPADTEPVENTCNIEGEPRKCKTTEEINAELIEENRRLREQLTFSHEMEEKYGNLINNLLEMLSSSGIQVKVRHD